MFFGNTSLCVLFIVILLNNFSSYASESIKLPLVESIKYKKNDSNNKLKLKLGTANYLSADKIFFSSRNASSTISQVELNFTRQPQTMSGAFFDISALYSVEEKIPYLNFSEGYYKKQWEHSELIVGRKRNSWFQQEDLWFQGLWHPRFAWDGLEKENQGLLATFYKHKYQAWSFTGFVMPFFIPGIGPSFREDNGALKSSNPWFRQPLSTIDIEETSGETKINYSLADIDIWSDILNHQGFGVVAEFKKEAARASLGYAYKPMNQLFLGFPFEMQIGGEEDQVAVEVYPRVLNHHIVSLEAELNSTQSFWQSWVNTTIEVPEFDNASESWVKQETTRAIVFSTFLGYSLRPFNNLQEKHDSAQVYASVLKVIGGDSQDVGPTIVLKKQSYFERRFEFTEALMLGIKNLNYPLLGRAINSQFEVLYDNAQNGVILSAKIKMEIKRHFHTFLNLDLLGLINEGSAEIEDGFIRNFRANDRIMAGVSYVF